jgi:hypothetical protein
VIARPEVQELLKSFVFAELYTDRKDPAHRAKDEANARVQEDRFATAALPLYVLLGPDGQERARLLGKSNVPEFVEFLKKGLQAPTSANGSR